jgi:hypothetical protein
MPLVSAVNGAQVTIKSGTYRSSAVINGRATMSGRVVGSLPQLGQSLGVVKDLVMGARTFNGTSSWLRRAFASAVTDDITLGIWVTTTTTASQQTAIFIGDRDGFGAGKCGYGIYHESSGTPRWLGVGFHNTNGQFTVGGATSVPSVADREEFLVLRRSSGTWQLFHNGAPVGTTATDAPSAPNTVHSRFAVGARNDASVPGVFLSGKASHAFLMHGVLTNAQILALYQAGPGGIGLAADRILTGTYWYYPIRGLASPEAPTAGSDDSTTLTVTDAPATTDGPLVLSSTGIVGFAGEVEKAPVAGLGGWGVPTTEVHVAGVDFQGLLDRVVITATRSSESLTARVAWLITEGLDDEGVTIHPDQDTGPTLEAATYSARVASSIVEDIVREVSGTAARSAVLTYLKEFGILLPADRPAPFDVIYGNGVAIGDIVVEESLADYANQVHLVVGDTRKTEVAELFTGNGSTDTWNLRHPSAGDRGYVSVDTGSGIVRQTLSNVDDKATWWINRGVTPNQLHRTDGNLTSGHVASIVHDAQWPIVVTAEDTGEQATRGLRSVRVEKPELFDLTKADALVVAELATRLEIPTTVHYSTLTDGAQPGMSQTVTVASRGVDETAMITEVSSVSLGPDLVKYEIVAAIGPNYRTWQQTYQRWGGGAGGGRQSIASAASIAASLGVAGSLQFQDVPFDAGNFTASDSGTWTVASDDVEVFRYAIIGKVVLIQIGVSASSVSGAPGILRIALPFGATYNANWTGICLIQNAGTYATGIAGSLADNQLAIFPFSGGWSNSTNTTGVWVSTALKLE